MRNIHFELARFLARVLFTVMNMDCDFRGRENLPAGEQPYILALNHASILDPPVVWAFFPEPVYFVTKSEIHRIPLIGRASNKVGNIGIRRGQVDRAAIRLALGYLSSARRVIGVFVEGTRTPDGEIHEAKNGSALLVLRTGVPVIPAYIHGTFDVWPRHWLTPGWRPRLSLTLGPALQYARAGESPPKERLLEVASDITRALTSLRRSVLEMEAKGAA